MNGIKPSEFTAAPPVRKPLLDALKLVNLKKAVSKVFYFIALVVGMYDTQAQNPTKFTSVNPTGEISKDQLALCQAIYDEAKERDDRLGHKSTFMLSSIAILVPIIISTLVYISTITTLSHQWRLFTLVIATISLIFLFLGFFAAFRSLSVRGYDTLYLQSVIDIPKKEIKHYSADTHGRGLLWCATKYTAMNDHKADFVRASQLFIILSILFLLISSLPLIYTMSPEAKVQRIKGDVNVTSRPLEAMMFDIKNEIRAARIDSEDKAKLEQEISNLNQQTLMMKKDIQSIRKRIGQK